MIRNNLYKRTIIVLIITLIISILSCNFNVNAKKKKTNNAGSKIFNGGDDISLKEGKACKLSNMISCSFERDGDYVNVKLSSTSNCGGDWKAYVGAPNNKNDISDYFSSGVLNSSILSIETWKDASDDDGINIPLNAKDGMEHIQVFVAPNGVTTIKNPKGYSYTIQDSTVTFDSNSGNFSVAEPSTKGVDRTFFFEAHKDVESTQSHKKSAKGKKNETLDNPIKSTPQCEAMNNSQYYIASSSKVPEGNIKKIQDYIDAHKEDFQKKMQMYFPYCSVPDGPNISFSQKLIKEVRHDFMKYYYQVSTLVQFTNSAENQAYQNLVKSYEKDYPTESKKTVVKSGNKYTTNMEDISCGLNSKVSETQVFWAKDDIVDNDVCTVTCVEKLTTTYSPPVFTKAGLCFTYKVTVKSKVDCGSSIKSSFTGDAMWPKNIYTPPSGSTDTDSFFCNVGAECDGNSHTQAGPDEEFESCIKDCDGGKYTDKCSDKCYNKIYNVGNAVKNNKKSSILNLDYTNNKESKVEFLSGDKKSAGEKNADMIEEALDEIKNGKKVSEKNDPYRIYYYKDSSGNVKKFDIDKNCSTFSDVDKSQNKENATLCIKAFYHAKTELPLGEYSAKDTSKNSYDWKPWYNKKKVAYVQKWKESSYYNSDSNRNISNANSMSIVESVKRAAPYYFVSIYETENSLRAMFGKDENHGIKNKIYDFDDGGIKRRHTASYDTCPDNCWFYVSNDGDCVKTSQEAEEKFESPDFNKLKKIKQQIEECNKAAKESCSESEATFYISSKSQSKSGAVSCSVSNGTEIYKAENIEKNIWGGDSKNICSYSGSNNTHTADVDKTNAFSGDEMFVKLYNDNDDRINGISAINSLISKSADKYLSYQDTESTGKVKANGINGSCYGIGKVSDTQKYSGSHQYKTTISFPGVYINKKSSEISRKDVVGSERAREKFCTAFDQENVNEEWWKAADAGESYSGSIDYNIKAQISNFGKFGWTYTTRCFYGIFRGKKDPEYCDEDDPNYPTCANIRVVDPKDVFNVKTDASNKNKIGFNWKSEAKIPDTFDGKLKEGGYTIDPQEYLKSVETIAQGNTNIDVESTDYTNSSGTYNDSYLDFHAQITPDNMSTIRSYSNKISRFDINPGNSCSGDGSGYFVPYGDPASDGSTKLVFSVYHSCILEKLRTSSIVKKDNFSSTNRKNGGDS